MIIYCNIFLKENLNKCLLNIIVLNFLKVLLTKASPFNNILKQFRSKGESVKSGYWG